MASQSDGRISCLKNTPARYSCKMARPTPLLRACHPSVLQYSRARRASPLHPSIHLAFRSTCNDSMSESPPSTKFFFLTVQLRAHALLLLLPAVSSPGSTVQPARASAKIIRLFLLVVFIPSAAPKPPGAPVPPGKAGAASECAVARDARIAFSPLYECFLHPLALAASFAYMRQMCRPGCTICTDVHDGGGCSAAASKCS